MTRRDEHKPLYHLSFFESLANGTISPFLPIFALSLGATKTLIGLQSSLPRILGNLSQLFWTSFTETVRKKKFLVIVGGLLWSVLWLPIAYSKDPYMLIALLTLQSIVAAVGVPAWTILFIETSPNYKRGEITGELRWYMGIGSLLSTLFAGFILNKFGFIPFIFFLAFFLGVSSRVVLLRLREPRRPIFIRKKELKTLISFSGLSHSLFKNFIISMVFLNFAVGLPGPLFSVYIIQNLKGNTINIGLISVINTIAALVSYRAWGGLIDYLGKRTIMLACLIPISLVPFWYFITPRVEFLYIFVILNGISWAGFNMASFTYLSNIVPRDMMEKNIAMYNITTTFSNGIGHFVGGFLADLTTMRTVFLLSSLLRFLSYYYFERLGERKGFKIHGFLSFATEPQTLLYRAQTFTSTYSMLMDRIKKGGFRFLNHTKRLYNYKVKKR